MLSCNLILSWPLNNESCIEHGYDMDQTCQNLALILVFSHWVRVLKPSYLEGTSNFSVAVSNLVECPLGLGTFTFVCCSTTQQREQNNIQGCIHGMC